MLPTTPAVLVVDDEPDVRTFTTLVLRSCGCEPLEAEDGQAAARIAEAHPGRLDLVVMDVNLPGESGPAVAAELLDIRPELRVLFISGLSNRAAVGRGEFLGKPFSIGDLTRKVQQVLGMAPPGAV